MGCPGWVGAGALGQHLNSRVGKFESHGSVNVPASGRVLLNSEALPDLAGKELTFYVHQVGGHTCLVKPADSKTVFKPRVKNELLFYKSVASRCPRLADFIPNFFGKIDVQHDPRSPVNYYGQDPDKSRFLQPRWNSHDIRQYVVLEDLAGGAKLPCIMDLKMGCRPRSAKYTPARRHHKLEKLSKTTNPLLGFRLCGLQALNKETKRLDFWDKYWGREITVESMPEAIGMFFGRAPQFPQPQASEDGVASDTSESDTSEGEEDVPKAQHVPSVAKQKEKTLPEKSPSCHILPHHSLSTGGVAAALPQTTPKTIFEERHKGSFDALQPQ